MNAMSALYHIAQNDSPSLSPTSNDPTNTPPVNPTASSSPQWSDSFKNFVDSCLKKNPQNRPSANELLQHAFILTLSDRKTLVNLIRKTKEIVRDLDNLQYRKMKKIIMAEGSNSSGLSSNLESGDQMRDRGGSESGGSSLLNLKIDGSESSQLEDMHSQLDDFDEHESSSMVENFNSVSDNDNDLLENLSNSSLGMQQMVLATAQLNLNKSSEMHKTATMNSIKSSTSSSKVFVNSLINSSPAPPPHPPPPPPPTQVQSANYYPAIGVSSSSSSTTIQNNEIPRSVTHHFSSSPSTNFSVSNSIPNNEIVNLGDSLKRRVSHNFKTKKIIFNERFWF